MKKEWYICFIALFVCFLVIAGCVSTPEEPEPTPELTAKPTPEPTPEPTKVPEPTEEPGPKAGELWMKLSNESITENSLFSTELRINTGDQKVAAYGIKIHYDDSVLSLVAERGNDGVVAGVDGFVAAVNAVKAGTVVIAGFDTTGKGPGDNLHLLTIYWKAVKKGSTTIKIEIDKLADELTQPLGVTKVSSISFNVE